LVAARHPDRFNSVGRARWRGRIYGAHVRPLGRQRVYRGAYGAAAYQSVYRGGGSVLDLTHQVGIPLASALTLTAPLGLLAPLLVLPSICAALFLAALLCIDAVRVTPPTALRQGRACFRLHVGWLALGQPAVRAWGRARAVSTARRDLPRARPLVGPARRLRGGIVALPSVAPRPETAAAVVDVIRRARVAVLPPTGWEARDAGLSGSLLVTGDLVTSGYPEGLVQVRVRRGVRRVAVAVVTVVAVSCWLVLPVLGAIVVGAVLLDALWGAWRTGPRVRRAIVEAAEQP
jgi:hypothetical protein